MRPVIDLIGQRFGRLVVLEQAGLTTHKKATWRCRCDCGQTCVVRANKLREGSKRSCGCSQFRIQHGHTCAAKKTGEFHSWQAMKQRCQNPNNIAYKNYGGRGIKVEFSSFEEFLAHVGPRPPHTSIDRIDNDGHYALGNVRWADRKTQAANKRPRKRKEIPNGSISPWPGIPAAL